MGSGAVSAVWNGLCRGAVLCFAVLMGQLAYAHGSVTDEADQCLLSIGFYRAHFTVYQPRSRGHEEFCEDLPEVGETVFVVDYLHQTLREVPVEFRILRDRHGVGRFARYEDVLDLDPAQDTVFYQAPLVESDAIFTVVHEFVEPGGYIGVISAREPQGEELFRAVFPFEVGGFPWRYVVGAVLLLPVVLLGVYLQGGWRRLKRQSSGVRA